MNPVYQIHQDSCPFFSFPSSPSLIFPWLLTKLAPMMPANGPLCPSSFEQSNTSVASCHKWTPGDVWTNMEFIIYFILCVFMCFYVVLFFAIYLYFFLFSSYFRLFYFICFYLLLFAIMLCNNWTPLIELPPIGLPISIEDTLNKLSDIVSPWDHANFSRRPCEKTEIFFRNLALPSYHNQAT